VNGPRARAAKPGSDSSRIAREGGHPRILSRRSEVRQLPVACPPFARRRPWGRCGQRRTWRLPCGRTRHEPRASGWQARLGAHATRSQPHAHAGDCVRISRRQGGKTSRFLDQRFAARGGRLRVRLSQGSRIRIVYLRHARVPQLCLIGRTRGKRLNFEGLLPDEYEFIATDENGAIQAQTKFTIPDRSTRAVIGSL